MKNANWALVLSAIALLGVAALAVVTLAPDLGRGAGERKLISSGSKYEELAAYSRAVVDGDWIFVSGTIGFDPVTGLLADSANAQTEQIFRTIENALGEADAGLSDIVRTRICLRDAGDIDAVAEVLRRRLGDIRPANITLVCQLMVEDAKVEIEVTARRH